MRRLYRKSYRTNVTFQSFAKGKQHGAKCLVMYGEESRFDSRDWLHYLIELKRVGTLRVFDGAWCMVLGLSCLL